MGNERSPRSLHSGVLPSSQIERIQEMLKSLQIDRKYVRQKTDIQSSVIYVINVVKPCSRRIEELLSLMVVADTSQKDHEV